MIDLVADRVWLAAGFTDMRKSIDGLAAIVKYEMGLDPLEPAIFVFCGRRRDRTQLSLPVTGQTLCNGDPRSNDRAQ